MTRDSVRAQQSRPTPKPIRMERVTVATASPLTITLPSGAVVAGFAVQGFTYTPGDAAIAFIQEPLVGPVYPAA